MTTHSDSHAHSHHCCEPDTMWDPAGPAGSELFMEFAFSTCLIARQVRSRSYERKGDDVEE